MMYVYIVYIYIYYIRIPIGTKYSVGKLSCTRPSEEPATPQMAPTEPASRSLSFTALLLCSPASPATFSKFPS